MPASAGRRSSSNSEPPISEAVRNPFCAARKFQAVNGEASAIAIAAGRRTIAQTTIKEPSNVTTSQLIKAQK